MNLPRTRILPVLIALALLGTADVAEAGGPRRRRVFAPTPTGVVSNPANDNAPTDQLGTFYSTPTIIVAGDNPVGGGYSPLGQYGYQSSMTITGPISAYRSSSAPVRIYSRGYDGVVRGREGTSFSTPNYPPGSPVIYPTTAAPYYRSRRAPVGVPTAPASINWLDQN